MSAVADISFFEENGIVSAFKVSDGTGGRDFSLDFAVLDGRAVFGDFDFRGDFNRIKQGPAPFFDAGDKVERILRLSFSHGSICKSS